MHWQSRMSWQSRMGGRASAESDEWVESSRAYGLVELPELKEGLSGLVELDKLAGSNEGCESAESKQWLELDELAESNRAQGASPSRLPSTLKLKYRVE